MPFNMSRITKALLIANLVGFGLQWLLGDARMQVFELWPIGDGLYDPSGSAPSFMPWQLLSYGFMHDPTNIFHLAFNMLALVMFGAPLEYTWGERRFLTYYLVCVVGAGLCQLLVGSMAVAMALRRTWPKASLPKASRTGAGGAGSST